MKNKIKILSVILLLAYSFGYGQRVLESRKDSVPCPVVWSPPVQLSDTTFSNAYFPHLVCVGDTLQLCYKAGYLYHKHSFDGGATWSRQQILVTDSLNAGQSHHPFDASGENLYWVYSNANPSGAVTSIKLLRSTNAGITWLAPQVILTNNLSSSFQFEYPLVAACDKHIYIVMQRFSGIGTIPDWYYCTHSTDYGVTWDSLKQITFDAVNYTVNADIKSLPGGIVHLLFERLDHPSGQEIAYVRTTNYGASWGSAQVISTADQYPSYEPDIAVGNSNMLYACWVDAKYGSIGGFAATAVMRKTSNNGITWSQEMKVSPFAASTGPSISVQGANVHIVYNDEREGLSHVRVMYIMSTDGGINWCNETVLGDTLQGNKDGKISAHNDVIDFVWSSNTVPPQGSYDIYYRKGAFIHTNVWGSSQQTQPDKILLLTNFPNPFNSSTNIEYHVEKETYISIKIYDILGQIVKTLKEGIDIPGIYRVQWDGMNDCNASVGSGVYIVQVFGGNFKKYQSVTLIH